MAIMTSDPSANKNEYIAQAAEAIGRSAIRAAIFNAIYTGKRAVKTVIELMARTKLKHKAVLTAGKVLADHEIVDQEKCDGVTAYRKRPFYQRYKQKILKLAASPEKLNAHPTKWSPATKAAKGVVAVSLKVDRAKSKQITMDDIDTFSKAGSVKGDGDLPKSVSEAAFKKGVQKIIGQSGDFKDWGGETNDLSTTRIRIGGRRRATAFAFKGPGVRPPLTPNKMGKNGDQIQRLFGAPAEVFIVQFWSNVHEAVLKQMAMLAALRSVQTGSEILYGIIDGEDSNRLYEAYKNKF